MLTTLTGAPAAVKSPPINFTRKLRTMGHEASSQLADHGQTLPPERVCNGRNLRLQPY